VVVGTTSSCAEVRAGADGCGQACWSTHLPVRLRVKRQTVEPFLAPERFVVDGDGFDHRTHPNLLGQLVAQGRQGRRVRDAARERWLWARTAPAPPFDAPRTLESAQSVYARATPTGTSGWRIGVLAGFSTAAGILRVATNSAHRSKRHRRRVGRHVGDGAMRNMAQARIGTPVPRSDARKHLRAVRPCRGAMSAAIRGTVANPHACARCGCGSPRQRRPRPARTARRRIRELSRSMPSRGAALQPTP